jgi:DNA repair exonuclease SbcCD ATPase subunit
MADKKDVAIPLILLTILILPTAMAANITQNQTATVIYDANMMGACQSSIVELQKNITQLNEEFDMKNKQIAELIQLKKTNVELQKNISKLNNQITTLKAENELLNQQNKQYRDLITDLIAKTSNQEDTKEIYEKNKKLIGGFTWSFTIGLVCVCVFAYSLIRLKRKYEDL